MAMNVRMRAMVNNTLQPAPSRHIPKFSKKNQKPNNFYFSEINVNYDQILTSYTNQKTKSSIIKHHAPQK